MLLVTKEPTPVLNTPSFSKVFGKNEKQTLLTNEKGFIQALEFIALPNTPFNLIEDLGEIYCVQTEEYPIAPLYVNRHFIRQTTECKRTKKLPPKEVVLDRLLKCLGLPYVWGGNWSLGIPKLLKLYPPSNSIDKKLEAQWTLQGVDCSGLLYEATEGFTPRNTKELFSFGREIKLSKIAPLDCIVFPGHVIIALDKHRAIESCAEKGGVVISPLKERFEEMKNVSPLTKVIRFYS